MRDLEILSVKQVRVFPSDVVPLFGLATREGRLALTKAFQFLSANAGEDEDLVVFKGGSIRVAERPVAVTSLHLNDRRIVVEVVGNSDEASAAFVLAWNVLAGHVADDSTQERQGGDIPAPVFFSEECTTSVTLDFDWADLFSPGFAALANGSLTDSLSSDQVHAEISTFAIGVGIRYRVADPSITESRVVVADKQVRIEPRVGSRREQKRYFVHTPTGSDEHARILERIEAAVGKDRR